MTTLFNLFCPFFASLTISFSVFSMIFITLISIIAIIDFPTLMKFKQVSSQALFPGTGKKEISLLSIFLLIAGFNLISLTGYSFPVTTTLALNLGTAMVLWGLSMVLMSLKPNPYSAFLPLNTPSYLIPFLSVVELVSVSVRPATLCFRLLANMSAGHILLSLTCKLSFGAWLVGILLGLLELVVSVVQSFVFVMLVSVYLEESFNH